jgi:hypothetical protein
MERTTIYSPISHHTYNYQIRSVGIYLHSSRWTYWCTKNVEETHTFDLIFHICALVFNPPVKIYKSFWWLQEDFDSLKPLYWGNNITCNQSIQEVRKIPHFDTRKTMQKFSKVVHQGRPCIGGVGQWIGTLEKQLTHKTSSIYVFLMSACFALESERHQNLRNACISHQGTWWPTTCKVTA